MGFSVGMLGPLLSGVVGAYSASSQGDAQAQQYLAQAKIAESNRAAAESQASESLKEGAREEGRFRRQARQFSAAQESQLAASGAALSGSALNVMADTAAGIEEDAAMIRYNTLKERWGYQTQAVNFANEATAARAGAEIAKYSGRAQAAQSLLGAAVNIYGMQPVSAKNGVINVSYGAGTGRYNEPQMGGGFYDPLLKPSTRKIPTLGAF